MAVYAPISGGYIHFTERWFSPAVGFAMGWQVTFQYCLFLPSEVIAANILISFWDTSESDTCSPGAAPDSTDNLQTSPRRIRPHT
jgi:amino acid permease